MNIPLPPLEIRQLVGEANIKNYDNPDGRLIWGDYKHTGLAPEDGYRAVFDFGCGCGRRARQLMLQNIVPKRYLGVDISPVLVEWCKNNLLISS